MVRPHRNLHYRSDHLRCFAPTLRFAVHFAGRHPSRRDSLDGWKGGQWQERHAGFFLWTFFFGDGAPHRCFFDQRRCGLGISWKCGRNHRPGLSATTRTDRSILASRWQRHSLFRLPSDLQHGCTASCFAIRDNSGNTNRRFRNDPGLIDWWNHHQFLSLVSSDRS